MSPPTHPDEEPETLEELKDRLHGDVFVAAIQGFCTYHGVHGCSESKLVATALEVADRAADKYPFITEDNQLKKGNTQ